MLCREGGLRTFAARAISHGKYPRAAVEGHAHFASRLSKMRFFSVARLWSHGPIEKQSSRS